MQDTGVTKRHADWESCAPAFIEIVDGKGHLLPDEHPTMQKILSIYATFTPFQRQCYHRVMCENSRDPVDVGIVKLLVARFQE